MTTVLERPATNDRLFLWIMHRFAEVFEDHAVLKGGLALRLLDSPRATTDIDYVFVPYESKKAIRARIEAVLAELEGAQVDVDLHSKMLRADIRLDDAAIQVEVNVAKECKTTPMTTGSLARAGGQPSHVVRIMSLDYALAHKLAAWNERRLLRDLYDCYFLAGRLGEKPNEGVLDARLTKIESKLPKLRKTRSMSRAQLASELRDTIDGLTQVDLENELRPLLPPEELAGLTQRMRAAISKICDELSMS